MPKKDPETYGEKEALERMNKALKGAMKEPPKPHKEMAKGRRVRREGKGTR